MPPRKKLIKRKKLSSSSRTTAPDDNDHESTAPGVETETELTDNVKFDDLETNVSVHENVSKPNLTEIKSLGINSERLINEDRGELDAKSDAEPDCVRRDEPEKQKVDLQETENNVDAVVDIYSAQEEMTTVKVDGIKILNDSNNSVVVKSDDNEKGEEIAEVVLAQKSNVREAPCKNNDALVVEDGGDGGVQDSEEIFTSHESAQDAGTQTSCENNTVVDVKVDSKDGGDDDELDDDNERDDDDNDGNGADHEDQDRSLAVQDSPHDDKKDKGVEIYVGKLDKDTVEDDLVNVFQQFGELKSIRIVRSPVTKKSKGYAFVRFASIDQAKRALSELKDGFEVRGKHVMVSASQDKDTLFLGNICKIWKKEEVLQQLKHYGIEHIETIRIPEDPKISRKIKGFAFLEFTTHSDATEAFQRLQKPDVFFGRDISAKVAFARAPMHSIDEDSSKINRVFVEGLTKDWNEEKVKEICNKYGEIVKINLCQSSGTKQRGFITFASPESALGCVEGINNTAIGGEAKIIAGIVKSQQKSSRQKLGFSGGSKVEKQTDVPTSHKDGGISNKNSEPKSSKMKGVVNTQQPRRNKKGPSKREVKIKANNTVKPQQKGSLKKHDESSKAAELPKMKAELNSQQAKSKRKAPFEQKLSERDQGTPKKPKKGDEVENSNTASKARIYKRKKATTYEGHEDRGHSNTRDKKPQKKPKGNMHERERNILRNPKVDTSSIRRQDDYRNSTRYTNLYAPKYAVSAPTAYHYGPDSLSARRLKEMEPHAGYIEPSSATRSLSYSRYVQPVVRTSHTQHQTVYLEPASTSQSHIQSRYLDRSGLTQSHRGYIETAVVPMVQPYRDYRSSEYVKMAHDPYDSGLARVVQHDGRGAGAFTYVGGPPPPASSQVQNHRSYYQVSDSYSGAYSSQRTYG